MSIQNTFSGGADKKVRVNGMDPPRELSITGPGVTVTDDPSAGTYDIFVSAAAGGSGEANTSSNAGVTGVGIVLPKVSINLPFKALNVASNKLSISDNTTNKTVDFDVVEANLNIADMTGSLGNARLTDISYSKLLSVPTTIVQTNQANTFGNFAQVFASSQLKINNPAGTFAYILVSSAITANRNITMPLLTGDDQITFDAYPTTLTNKTIAVAGGNNTITGIVDVNIDAHTTSKITTTSKALLNSSIVYTDQINTFGAFAQTFPSSQLHVNNPAGTFAYIIAGSAITANRTLTIPLLLGNDQVTTDAFATTLTNKTLTASANTITGLVDANMNPHTTSKITTLTKALLNTSIAYVDQSNTFSANDQIIPSGNFKLSNSGFSSILSVGTLAGNVTLTLPSIADTVVARTTTDTLTNKTLVAASNTITDTSAVTGDILRHNGTKFVRLARGTANQVLTVNSGATDIAWAAATGGGFTEAKGSSTQSGDASTTAFNIAHGLTGTPTWVNAEPKTTDADDDFAVTVDATNITITYPFPPPTATNNLAWWWRAAL
jgi:hypothetical protein